MLGVADNTEGNQGVAGLAVVGCEHREALSEPEVAGGQKHSLAAASYGVLSPAEGKGL